MPKKILVVEDNEMNRLLIRDLLIFHGYEVMEASDGREAMKIARERLPDLILMDIQMPVMDGVTAMRRLRDDPATAGIKVIAVTSFAMKGDREKYMEDGFDDYVTKPLNTRELPGLIRKHLGEDTSPA